MIKERVIKLLEFKGIPKEKFYDKIGVTSANFRGNAKKTPLNSTTIENILSEIPDLNLEWLLTGNGSMLKENSNKSLNTDKNTFKEELNSREVEQLKKDLETIKESLKDKNQILKMQNKYIEKLEQEIESLKNKKDQ